MPHPVNLAASSDQGFASLQWARAVAALAVVVYHCGQAIEARTGVTVTPFTDFGAAGVDVFFVISGLIMTMTTRKQSCFSAPDFLMRRIIRIVPIYWFYTLLKSGILLANPGASLYSQFSVSQLLASLFFIPISEHRGIFPILVVGWTLNCEALFYVLFAMSKALAHERSMILLVAILAGLAAIHSTVGNWCAPATLWSEPIMLEFAFGIGAAEAYLAGMRPSAGLFIASLVLLGTFGLVVIPEVPKWRWLFWGIPATCLVFGMLSADRLFPFRRVRVLIALGDSSYSLYLVHTIVIPVLAALSLRVTIPSAVAATWALVWMTCGCVAIGWFSFILLELPMTRGLKAAWRKQRVAGEADLISAPNAR